jgi:hypothetical protein
VWASLSAVSCWSATACTAVGSWQDFSNKQLPAPLAERWDGTAWVIQTAASPSGGPFSTGVFSSVSCSSPTACVAVGTADLSPTMPLAEHWDGASWRVDPTPVPPGMHGQLGGVSCRATANCVAVGTKAFNAGIPLTLAERWSGTAWTIRDTANPNGAQPGGLSAVSCPSSWACTAVGHAVTSAHAQGFADFIADQPALAERWDGEKWAIQAVPDPPGGLGSDLRAVSCPSSETCTAVGQYYDDASGQDLSLADRWENNHWVVQPTPNPPHTWEALLQGVSCVSSSACTAVGWYTVCPNCPQWPLAEHWDGSRWTFALPPRPPACPGGFCEPEGPLEAVACTTPAACIAVGFFISDSGTSPLSESWDGSAWAIRQVPDPPGGSGIGLRAVSCPSAIPCTAVGSYRDSGSNRSRSLAALWDGNGWTIESTPAPPDGAVALGLSGVSCTSPTSCTAVGGYENVTTRSDPSGGLIYSWISQHTISQHWDGATWSTQAAVDPVGAPFIDLNAVACAPLRCIAVGSYSYVRPALEPSFNLIEQSGMAAGEG